MIFELLLRIFIYCIYISINHACARAFCSSNLFENKRDSSIDKSNTKMFAINHMILGEKVFFLFSLRNFIPFGYTLSVVLSFTFFALVCILFFFCCFLLFDLLLSTILLVPLCTLSSSCSAPSKNILLKYGYLFCTSDNKRD